MAPKSSTLLLTILFLITTVTPASAFGAGYVAPGSVLKGARYRHGDIALAIPLLATANRRIVKQIYFGNWLRDFSQILDKGTLSIVPYPLLKALVAVFAFVQFGYATGEFEVTEERLGVYRSEEHVDNPKGYGHEQVDPAAETGWPVNRLRIATQPEEMDIDSSTGMKNYIAASTGTSSTSAQYVEQQLIAAIACGRQGNEEAYNHVGAALHALEDFLAHSNYVELSLQLIGREIQSQSDVTPALRQVFAFVGDGARVKTAHGHAPPIITGTFGALDLVQTLLGEIEDRASAVSLEGLETRTGGGEGTVQKLAKYIIGLLGNLTPDFEGDILKIQKAAANAKPATWGELESDPEKLWESIRPVFKLRDNVAKWVNDHLKVRAVQDALASISTAIDKLVYMILGIFLGPLLSEFSKVLRSEQERLLLEDQKARLAKGEQSIFDPASTSTDPTHSQLAKDHYDHSLNEIAGRVAVCVSSYTIKEIVQLWQPGNTQDPRATIHSILQAFHHPSNSTSNSAVQILMLAEVRGWVRSQLSSDATAFALTIQSLSKTVVASRMDVHDALPGGRTHVDPSATSANNKQDTGSAGKADTDRTTQRLIDNIKRQLEEGQVKGMGLDDFPAIEKQLLGTPSDDSPNPLDTGLSQIPGLSFLSAFEGIRVGEVATMDGLGETLKDALVTMVLLDEKREEEEEERAVGKLRWSPRTETEKEIEAVREERARLRELRALLEFEKQSSDLKEGQFDEKRGMGERLKLGVEKLKLKAST